MEVASDVIDLTHPAAASEPDPTSHEEYSRATQPSTEEVVGTRIEEGGDGHEAEHDAGTLEHSSEEGQEAESLTNARQGRGTLNSVTNADAYDQGGGVRAPSSTAGAVAVAGPADDPGGATAGVRRPFDDSTNTEAVVRTMPRLEPPPDVGEGAAKQPPAKRKKKTKRKAPETDGERCSICLDVWTSTGKHRICALLCGHLFGQACIERWLKERRSCPQCGAKVGPKSSTRVVPLFLHNLVAKDTAELETVRNLLDKEKRLRKQCEAERVRLSIHNESLKDQLSVLRRSECTIDGQSQRTQAGRIAAGRSQGKTPACLTPARASLATPSSTPGPASGASVTDRARTPSGLYPVGPSPGALPFSQSKPASWQGLAVDSKGTLGGDGCDGSGGGSNSSSREERRGAAGFGTSGAPLEAAGKTRVVVRFEHCLSKGLQAGRVATFAGGTAGALLVSQDFGAASGPRGSARHGVTKFSLADLRHRKNICLHREQVRDVKFSGDAGSVGYVLSTSFDKTLKVCDMRTDSVVLDYGLEGHGWSCQWSATNSTQMFCGIVDGTRTATVLVFDLRSTAGAVQKIHAAARQRQPVHSICHTADDQMFCATMGGVWAWGGGTKSGGDGGGCGRGEEFKGGEEMTAEQLKIQAGACCSLSYIHGGGLPHRFLVSTRGPSASHAVFGLEPLSASSQATAAAERGSGVGNAEQLSAERKHSVTAEATGDALREGRAPTDGERGEGSLSPVLDLRLAAGRRSVLAEPFSWAERWKRLPSVAQGHQSQHTLSRSLLWQPSLGAELLIAGGDERTNQPWMWDASTGEVASRLAAHRSPVLDVASFQDRSSGTGLFAAVSQGEMNLYQTSL